MSKSHVEETALRIIERLPDDATWEDVEHAISVARAIEVGLKDSREGRTVPHEAVRRRFEL